MFTPDQLLIFAARGGKIDLVRERLAAGADPTYYEAARGSALLTAISTRRVEIIHLLMRHGADIGQADERGYGALEYALRTGDSGVIGAVLQHGASLKAHRGHWREALRRYFVDAGSNG